MLRTQTFECPNMCKLNTSEQSPIVVWERDGETLFPRFVSPHTASDYHLTEGDEIDAGMRMLLMSADGPYFSGNFEAVGPNPHARSEIAPPVAVIDL